jgi:hypothetical protein
MAPYGDYVIARKLSGNVDPTDISDSDCIQAISYGDARVESETGHGGWLVTDPDYPLVKQSSEYFAASWIRDHYEDPDEKGDAHYSKAMDICFSIRESSAQSLFVLSSQYRTTPLNLNAPIYRSLPGTGGSTTGQDLQVAQGEDVEGVE